MSIQAQEHLETLFILDGRRIVSTREPNPGPGPEFVLIRRADSCAWAIGSGMGDEQVREVTRLALDEYPSSDFQRPPRHVEEYLKRLDGDLLQTTETSQENKQQTWADVTGDEEGCLDKSGRPGGRPLLFFGSPAEALAKAGTPHLPGFASLARLSPALTRPGKTGSVELSLAIW